MLFALPGLSSSNWSRTLLGSLAQWWSWGLVAPLIFWTDARLPFKENQLGMRILAHLLASVPLTLIYFYVVSWVVYWVIFGVIQTFRYYEHYRASELRLERMERNFSQARLNALRMQLDPHFLFNALNTVSSQVERNPRLARTMIEHLGDLLRLSLDARDKQEIPLAEELAFLDHYVAIQKIRFAETLRIALTSTVSLSFQPISHGEFQIVLKDGHRSRVSRTYRVQLERRLGQSL
jgi:two-component system LytT family sensor kinase